jgi:hypothetical protein
MKVGAIPRDGRWPQPQKDPAEDVNTQPFADESGQQAYVGMSRCRSAIGKSTPQSNTPSAEEPGFFGRRKARNNLSKCSARTA